MTNKAKSILATLGLGGIGGGIVALLFLLDFVDVRGDPSPWLEVVVLILAAASSVLVALITFLALRENIRQNRSIGEIQIHHLSEWVHEDLSQKTNQSYAQVAGSIQKLKLLFYEMSIRLLSPALSPPGLEESEFYERVLSALSESEFTETEEFPRMGTVDEGVNLIARAYERQISKLLIDAIQFSNVLANWVSVRGKKVGLLEVFGRGKGWTFENGSLRSEFEKSEVTSLVHRLQGSIDDVLAISLNTIAKKEPQLLAWSIEDLERHYDSIASSPLSEVPPL